jgi:hypothetical protein
MLRYHLNIFPEWRLDPFIFKKQCVMAILLQFSIETAYERYLTHIINQTTINSDVRI